MDSGNEANKKNPLAGLETINHSNTNKQQEFTEDMYWGPMNQGAPSPQVSEHHIKMPNIKEAPPLISTFSNRNKSETNTPHHANLDLYPVNQGAPTPKSSDREIPCVVNKKEPSSFSNANK